MTVDRKTRARERQRKWRAANPEREKEYAREYRAKNLEKRREIEARYREKHPDGTRQASRRYRASHLEEERTRKREYMRKLYAEKPWYYLNRSYGPGADVHYQQQFEKQAGRCAVCEALPTKEKLHLDHHHGTLHWRGLLCGNCNRVLGLCKESAERLRKLAAYLEQWGVAAAA